MRPRNIELDIEELVLDGFAGNDRQSIGEAVERELSRLFIEQGVPPSLEQGGRIEGLNGGEFKISSDSSAEVIGARAAQAVYGGLKK